MAIYRRRSRRYFLGALGAFGLPGMQRVAAAETYTMRLSFTVPMDSLQGASATRFAAAVLRRSNGQLKIEIYPGGQLAKQDQVTEELTTGILDFAIQSSSILEPLVPQFQVLDMPFLFKDAAVAYKVLDGPIMEELFAKAEPKGIVGLAWGVDGFRQIWTTSKAVSVPEDMKGIRMRIEGGPIYVATYQALGALPLTIDNSEIFLAVSQHTIDATDNPLPGFTSLKRYEYLKHVAMANHIVSVAVFLGSRRKIEALPPPLQKILRDEGKALVPFWRSLYDREVAADIQILRNNGVAFTDIQYPAFRKAMDPVYATMQPKLGDLLDRVSRAAGTAAGTLSRQR